MICLFFAVALMILAGMAYIFNTWKSLAFISSVPFVTLFSYWWFVPESPRWLLSYGKIDEAEVVVQSIAKWKKKTIPPDFVHQFCAQHVKQETKKSEETSVKAEKSERQLLEGKPNMIRLFWYYP